MGKEHQEHDSLYLKWKMSHSAIRISVPITFSSWPNIASFNLTSSGLAFKGFEKGILGNKLQIKVGAAKDEVLLCSHCIEKNHP